MTTTSLGTARRKVFRQGTQGLRANQQAIDLEREAEVGMRAKSVEFVRSGATVYTEVAK